MMTNLKALVVVLVIATTMFALAKPLCLRFMAENDFARRRNVWFVLTVTAFTSPSFWLFVLLALPLLAWTARKDSNPVALYIMMMHIISPNDALYIPVIGINQLFELNAYRILSFSILIPAAWRLMQSPHRTRHGGLVLMDMLILSWIALQLVLFIPHDSMTHSVRRGFLIFVDVLVLYFVVSRTCTSKRLIAEVMAVFLLICAILAPLALFESLRSWLLYGEIGNVWGTPPNPDYLFRGGTLRAQVSTGHAIALGYMMAVALGFWIYLRSRLPSTPLTRIVAFGLCGGLLAAYSRGPWVVALVIFFAALALGPNGIVRLFKASLVAALAAGIILISPIGGRVIANLPFVGTVDAYNVTYRQQLAKMSWELIQENPFFGDVLFLSRLETLRQGQGIVDLMNAYAAIGMSFGIVGLGLLLGCFVIGIFHIYRVARKAMVGDLVVEYVGGTYHRHFKHNFKQNPDVARLGAVLISCMLGTLTMMAVGGFGSSVEKMYYVLAGLAAGYAQLDLAIEKDESRQATVPDTQTGWSLNRTK